MDHDVVIGIQLVHALAQLAQRDQDGAGNPADVILVGLPHIQNDGGSPVVQHRPEFLGCHFVGLLGLSRPGRSLRRNAAELLVVDQGLDGGLLSAERALRILAQLQLPELHLQGIVKNQTADQGPPAAQNQLDGFGGLNQSDDSGEDSQDAPLGATGNQSRRRRLRIEAAVAGTLAGVEHRRLALEPEDAPVDVGLVQQNAGVVHQVAGGEVVGSVDHDVVSGNDVQGVVGRQHGFVGLHPDVGIDIQDLLPGGVQLGTTHVLGAVNDLPLQVAEIDGVEVDQPQLPDAGGRKIEAQRSPQAPGPHQQDAGGLQLLLALHADFGHDEVPAVALDLIPAEVQAFRSRLDGRKVAAGDGGHDAHHVTFLHRGPVFLQIADILVVDIDVDEVADLPLLVQQVWLELGKMTDQSVDHLAHGIAGQFHLVPIAREMPQRHRQEHLQSHFSSSRFIPALADIV